MGKWTLRVGGGPLMVYLLTMTKTVKGRVGWAVVKKLLKAIPIIGPVFTVGFAGHDIKKKGLVPGAVHVGLDVTPIVGTAKNVIEIVTGDWIPDKDSKPEVRAGANPPSGPGLNNH